MILCKDRLDTFGKPLMDGASGREFQSLHRKNTLSLFPNFKLVSQIQKFFALITYISA